MLNREPQPTLADVMQRIEHGRSLADELLMTQPQPPSDLTQALLDAVALFEELDIGYALVGGIAAMYYGRSRFTEDADFVAAAGHEPTLAAHGDAMCKHHFDPDCTWKLYHASGAQIDLWKDEHSDGIVHRAREASIAGRTIRIADPHDLIAMKLRADRPQDDYDISEIVRRQPIDDDLLRMAVTADQFSAFERIRRRIRGDVT